MGLSQCERPGLVENDCVHVAGPLQRVTPLYQHTLLGTHSSANLQTWQHGVGSMGMRHGDAAWGCGTLQSSAMRHAVASMRGGALGCEDADGVAGAGKTLSSVVKRNQNDIA